jgi:hypothetical protein
MTEPTNLQGLNQIFIAVDLKNKLQAWWLTGVLRR